jgi:hypothetical protein
VKDTGAEEFASKLMKAIRIIEENHVTPTSEPQLVRWAVQGLYEGVKKPIPDQVAREMKELDGAGEEVLLGFLRAVRAGLGRSRELADRKDLQAALQGIFVRLEVGGNPADRSSFTRATELRDQPRECFRPPSVGVGLKLTKDEATGMIRVLTPIRNGPAHKAGIGAGDLITHIQVDTNAWGEPLPKPAVFSTKGMSVQEAGELLVGARGTRVRLTIIRADSADRDSRDSKD